MYAEWSKANQYFRTWKKYASKKRLIILEKFNCHDKIPWHFPDISQMAKISLTFFQNSLTIPWPGENFVFPWLFPDTWQPWNFVFIFTKLQWLHLKMTFGNNTHTWYMNLPCRFSFQIQLDCKHGSTGERMHSQRATSSYPHLNSNLHPTAAPQRPSN